MVNTQRYPLETFLDKYNDEFFLKLYFKIRTLEEEASPPENELNILYDDCVELFKSNGISRALKRFERIINKPFDKRGSLSYIKKYVDTLNDFSEPG